MASKTRSAGSTPKRNMVPDRPDLRDRPYLPSVAVKLFEDTVLPRIQEGTVKRFHQFHLSQPAEEQDSTCRPILGYGRSLVYLVSESFEGGVRTPILGMEKFFTQSIGRLNLPNVHAWTAPGAASASTTHGGCEDDEATTRSVISLIKTGALPSDGLMG